MVSVISRIHGYSPGYSFSKFMGPVSGIEHKIAYYDDGKYKQHDYIAKPDYHFEYGVRDPKSKVHQSRQETRHGDTVEGEYRCYNFEFITYVISNKNLTIPRKISILNEIKQFGFELWTDLRYI